MEAPKIIPKGSVQDAQATTTSQGSLATMVNIIEKYKTTRCNNGECKYNREKTYETDGLLLYDCFDFHSKTDQRRPVLVKVTKNKTNNSTLFYSRNVALEVLLGQKPNENSEKHCLNGYEYLYHPLNYKTLECRINKTSKCNSIFCPYYHGSEEQSYFEDYRKMFDQQTNKFPLVEEIQNNVNKINDLVKKTTNDHTKSPENDSPGANVKTIKDEKLSTLQTNGIQPKKKNKQTEEYYIYDDTVKFIEDHYHEFKCLKLHLDTVTKYICGFLNSKGGILYFGINNDGVVKGTDVKDFEIQSFKKKLYDGLKKFVPPIGEEEVKVNFVPVYKVNNKTLVTSIMQNSYVVEIMINKSTKSDLFFTNYRECFVKRSASINQLKTKEIKEYIKTFIQRKTTDTLQSLENKVSHYQGQKLNELSTGQLEELERQLKNTLEKVDAKISQKSANNKE